MLGLGVFSLSLFEAMRGWATKLRTLLVTALLAVWCLKALPNRPYDEALLARPANERMVAKIDHAFEAVGIHVARDAIKGVLIGATTPVITTRNALVEPLDPVFDFAQMGQRWGLFLQKGREGFRIQIEGRTADRPWAMLYRHHQRDVLGLRPWIGFRRLRGIYNPGTKSARAQYEGFVSWVAEKIFREYPQYRAVRVSMERMRLGTRREPSRSLAVEHVRVRVREEVL